MQGANFYFKKLKHSYDFDFLVVLTDAKDSKEALKYCHEKNLYFPLFYQEKAKNFFAKLLDEPIYAVPLIVFYDKNGFKDKEFLGLIPENILTKEILKLL